MVVSYSRTFVSSSTAHWPWLGIGFCLPITHSTGGTTHNSSLLSPAEVWGGGRSSQLINPQLSNKSHVDTSSVISNLYVKLDVYFTLITIIHSVWQLHGSSQGDTESQGAARRVFCNNNLLISGLLTTVNTQQLELATRGSTVSISKSLQSVEILPLLSWPRAAVWGMLTLPEVSVQCSVFPFSCSPGPVCHPHITQAGQKQAGSFPTFRIVMIPQFYLAHTCRLSEYNCWVILCVPVPAWGQSCVPFAILDVNF